MLTDSLTLALGSSMAEAPQLPSARIYLLKELASVNGSVRVTGELVEERGARLVLQALRNHLFNVYSCILYTPLCIFRILIMLFKWL